MKPGDAVGIVSPSWFGGEAFLPRARRGIAALERCGFEVRVGEHAFNNAGHVSDSARNRADDLHAMFTDSEVKAIITTIGGDHACHLLPLIDWVLIRSNPKVFMGFSDITVLNLAIWSQTGLVTFNGPSLMTDWAEFPDMPPFSERQALNAICRAEPMGDLSPSPWWTEEFLDWSTGADLVRPRTRSDSSGWQWLCEGNARGQVLGGCIESLQHLRGTRYWPDLDGASCFSRPRNCVRHRRMWTAC